jgi:catechol 2,3-dioxygenase-like lactoylglutathione lyase family enzyme
MDSMRYVTVPVTEIKAAIGWYCNRFEVQILHEEKSWAMLRFANVDVALVLPGEHPPLLAIERPDAEAFGKLQRHRDGTASVCVTDPAGNLIEVMKSPAYLSRDDAAGENMPHEAAEDLRPGAGRQ